MGGKRNSAYFISAPLTKTCANKALFAFRLRFTKYYADSRLLDAFVRRALRVSKNHQRTELRLFGGMEGHFRSQQRTKIRNVFLN